MNNEVITSAILGAIKVLKDRFKTHPYRKFLDSINEDSSIISLSNSLSRPQELICLISLKGDMLLKPDAALRAVIDDKIRKSLYSNWSIVTYEAKPEIIKIMIE